MRVFKLHHENAHEIQAYHSHGVTHLIIANHLLDAHIGMMFVDPQGVIGYHQASSDQLFILMTGSGWVAGADQKRVKIEPGQAAFWRSGEWHESGSDVGMTAVLIEADRLQPDLMDCDTPGG
jgi:quercetin dioxygenase-like cupin family protein